MYFYVEYPIWFNQKLFNKSRKTSDYRTNQTNPPVKSINSESIRATLFAYNVNIYHAVTGDILHDLNSDYYYTKY